MPFIVLQCQLQLLKSGCTELDWIQLRKPLAVPYSLNHEAPRVPHCIYLHLCPQCCMHVPVNKQNLYGILFGEVRKVKLFKRVAGLQSANFYAKSPMTPKSPNAPICMRRRRDPRKRSNGQVRPGKYSPRALFWPQSRRSALITINYQSVVQISYFGL